MQPWFSEAARALVASAALMQVFDEAGIVVTTPDLRELRVAGSAAFATVAWRQDDSSGETLHEFTCGYTLIDQHGVWRIATVVNETDAGEVAQPGNLAP